MDYQERQPVPRPQMERNSFLIASFSCAILAFFTECSLPVSMVFSALAILFAILSKKAKLKMNPLAMISVGIAVISLFISIIMTAMSLFSIIMVPEQREVFNQACEQLYGTTFDDELNQIQQFFQ